MKNVFPQDYLAKKVNLSFVYFPGPSSAGSYNIASTLPIIYF
jgi:hypothetical protein